MRWLNSTDLLVNPGTIKPDDRVIFRQIGWVSQTGVFYDLQDHPLLCFERGGFTPVFIKMEV